MRTTNMNLTLISFTNLTGLDIFNRDICDRSFKSLKGLRIHNSSCEKKEKLIINRLNLEEQNIGHEYVNQLENSAIVNTSEILIEINKNVDVTLPFYEAIL